MITSTSNAIIKAVAALRESKDRKAQGLCVIDGAREVMRAAGCGASIQQVIYCRALLPDQIDVTSIAGKSTALVEVDAKVFAKLAYGDRQDGVMAVARTPAVILDRVKLSGQPFIVVMEAVEKPGNLGAILRTCDGAGVDLVMICDPKTDIFNPNVIRASTGAVFKVPCAALTSAQAAAFLDQNKIAAVGAFPSAKDIYTQASLTGPLAIVLGTEDKGLSPFWQKQCRRKVKIPMRGISDSLNVSVSAAVLIYEALRQRSHRG